MKEVWNSGLQTKIRPIADKAIEEMGHELVSKDWISTSIEYEGYEVELVRNNILDDQFFQEMHPKKIKEATAMINVSVEVNYKLIMNIYYLIDGKWVNDRDLKD